MKNILLKFNTKRLEFLNSITPDFDGKQNTDRINHALDKVPLLQKQLQQSISISNEHANIASKRLQRIHQLKMDLNQIKYALNVLQVFAGSNSENK